MAADRAQVIVLTIVIAAGTALVVSLLALTLCTTASYPDTGDAPVPMPRPVIPDGPLSVTDHPSAPRMSGPRVPGEVVLAQAASIDAVLTNLRNWIMGVLAGVATVCWTVAGVRYVIASGDPGEVERAKAAFRAGAWGYALAALAPVVVTILKGIVGV